MNAQPRIPVAYRPPFSLGDCYFREQLPGRSVLEIVRSVPNLPADFLTHGYVCINGEIVPREMWPYVRPKPASRDVFVSVTLHTALRNPGGGAQGRKSIIGLVAAIALIAVTSFITGGGAAALFGGTELFAAGSTSAQLLAGAVGVAGALAIGALSAPPTSAAGVDTGGTNTEQAEAASAQGNILDKSGAVPRVIGTRKIFPPLACEPVVELVNQDEFVEALFVLNGPHQISDIRLENNSIADADDVQVETREGWPTDTAVTLVTRQGRTITPQLELSNTTVGADGFTLVDQGSPTDDLPVWHGFASRSDPNELWIHLLFPGGISNGTTDLWRVPLRIRIRKRGNSWINLPEVHIQLNSSNQWRGAIVFRFATTWASPPDPQGQGFVYAHMNVPPQTATPGTPVDRQWQANSFFYTGAGDPYLHTGNLATTRLRNIKLFYNVFEIYFDPGQFPPGTFGPGAYEVEIKRGYTIKNATFNDAAYTYAAVTTDFFWYQTVAGNQVIAQTHLNISDRVIVSRVISIWNQAPLSTPGNFALIAVKAVNRSVRQLSCTASGYVKDWDGSAWNSTPIVTSNPAPHYVDVLTGSLNLDPLPTDLRGDTDLVAWRALCRANGWTCDAIINDMRVQDVLQLLASCGYARPYQSDTYKVVVDNDHSGQVPVQVFSRRNCANLRFERAFARVPAGFNVTYRDEANDDDQAQVAVAQRDPANTDMTLYESVSYDGLIEIDKVNDRALFDLDQANLRATFYYLDVDIESIVCQRGSLVAVEHDILSTRAGDGYIVSKQTSGGNITGVTLDAEIPILSGTTGVAIRRTDGTISTHQISNATGSSNVLTFTSPFPDTSAIQGFVDNDRKYGCLVVAGDLSTIYRRLLVHTIAPSQDLTAQMVLVDEAPALVRYPSTKTLLLAHMDGTNGSTSFPDSTSRHSISAMGTTVVDTSTKQFGSGGSAFMGGGSGNGLLVSESPDWNLGSVNFTIEAFVFLSSIASLSMLWSQGFDGNNYNGIFLNTSGSVTFQQQENGSTTFNHTTATGLITTNTWIHIALERFGDLWTLYTGGTVRQQTTNAISLSKKSGFLYLGCFVDTTFCLNGRLEEFRWSRVARYGGANYTPPASPHVAD